ncbi:MAG: hypothetical protein LCI00_24360 [Chloroflexi bacterium]|nr:hypothetical protein [Chloroflexota bacterium]
MTRLNRFLQLARTLDLSDAETLQLKQEFYWQVTSDGVNKFRDVAIAKQPTLEFDPLELFKEITKLQKESEEDYVVEQLGLYHRLRAELTIIQLIAMVDGYRTDATTLLFQKKTASLIKHKSDIVKLLSDVSSPLNWNDLYEDIIRVAVSNMTRNIKYRGWIEKIKNEFSLTPTLVPLDVDQFEEIIATRNLLAHNGCIVSQDYIDRSDAYYRHTGQVMLPIGSQRLVDQNYCTNAIQCISRVLQAIDLEVYRVTI